MLKKILMILSLLIVNIYAGEATLEKAQHRLPPVIYSIDIPKTVKPNRTYDFKWTVMGYHDAYNIIINVYDKSGKKIASKQVASYDETEGAYSWGTIKSTKYFYETEMSLDFTDSQELTIRFFASPPNDPINTTYLSCLVPGGSGYKAGDTTGRKILIDGVDEDEEILDTFFSTYFPYHNENIPVSKNGKRLDVRALKQENYEYIINGTNYKVAGCVPTTYAMAIDYGIRSNGYNPTSPQYTIEELLKEFDELKILSSKKKGTSVTVTNDRFINKINYKGFIDLFTNCQAPSSANFIVEREKGILLWTYNKFMSKTKSMIDNNRPIIISVLVFSEGNDNNYSQEGGHQMLITGYDDNKIYANDTWDTTYSTWNRVNSLNGLTFYKENKEITKKIKTSSNFNQNIIFKRGKLLIILLTPDTSFVTPKKIEFYDETGPRPCVI